MWIRLDDGFATHPKILKAGLRALTLQVRAICYASQHKTDGVIPEMALPLLTYDLDEDSDGEIRSKPDWPQAMIDAGLWEPQDRGYVIHDYLAWNCSKKEYEDAVKQKSRAGKKGMKARWGKRSPRITGDITPVITPVITERYHATSTSTSTLNPLNSPNPDPNLRSKTHPKKSNGLRPISDDDKPTEKNLAFGKSLQIEVGPEWGKFKNYCLAHGKRYANFEAAFRNWLARSLDMKGLRA